MLAIMSGVQQKGARMMRSDEIEMGRSANGANEIEMGRSVVGADEIEGSWSGGRNGGARKSAVFASVGRRCAREM